MAKTRRKYKGNATATTIPSGLASGASLCTVAAATGWPTSGPFYAVIDPGLSTEEKILVGSISGTSLSSITRGVDDTSDQTHASGCAIYPVFTAVDADEANELVSTWTTKGDLVAHGSSTFARLAVGTNNHVLMADSTQTTGLKYAQVGESSLASDAVTTAKIADSAVTSAKIANGTIVAGDLADGAVTSAKILDGTIVEGDLADGAVTSAKILDGTIVDADINAAAAITLSKLANGALPTGITVASANIVDGTIVAGDLASDAVTEAKILNGSVTVNKLGDGAVTSAKILDGTIVDADINAAAAISLSKLETTALPTGITVASANIVDGTIVDADINASAAIALTKLASGTAGRVVMYNASGVATATAVSGDVTISNTGVTTVGTGVLSGSELSSTAALSIGSVITTGNIKSGGTFKTTNTSAGTYLTFENDTGTNLMQVDASTGVHGQLVSGGRNMMVISSQVIGYTSSTIRTKQDISAYEFDEQAVLSIEPKRFRYNDKVEGGGDGSPWQYGFIAEEAVAAGLPELCGFDETGQPDYFAYERMCVAQQQLIRTLWAKVQDLEARVGILEDK